MGVNEGPMTQSIKASDVRAQWSRLVNQVFSGERRILVEKSGIPVAALVSAQDLRRLLAMEAQREEDFHALWRTGEAFKGESAEDIEREVSQAVAAVRQEQWAEAKQRSAIP